MTMLDGTKCTCGSSLVGTSLPPDGKVVQCGCGQWWRADVRMGRYVYFYLYGTGDPHPINPPWKAEAFIARGCDKFGRYHHAFGNTEEAALAHLTALYANRLRSLENVEVRRYVLNADQNSGETG